MKREMEIDDVNKTQDEFEKINSMREEGDRAGRVGEKGVQVDRPVSTAAVKALTSYTYSVSCVVGNIW